jgi:hypothetical protein
MSDSFIIDSIPVTLAAERNMDTRVSIEGDAATRERIAGLIADALSNRSGDQATMEAQGDGTYLHRGNDDMDHGDVRHACEKLAGAKYLNALIELNKNTQRSGGIGRG